MTCNFAACKAKDIETYTLTRDRYGYHWFCHRHWKFIVFLFKIIRNCSRKKDGCVRNHHAEISELEKYLNTTKFEGKYWDLCDKHLATYDELLGIDLIFGDYD